MTSHTIRAAAALLGIAAAQPASSQTPVPPPVTHLRQVVDSLAEAGHFSGVVVLSRNGEPVLELAHGMADREAGRANDVETAFNLGSLNKLFTRIAVEQLVAEGRIHRDSTISAYWPDYPNGEVARRVTIAQLLEHRSGLGGNIFDAPPGGTRADIRHNRDFVQLFASEPLQFEPGTSRRYSNAGYVVLGEIVARVTGEDYYDYVRRSIYQPAGMTRTGHFALDSLPPVGMDLSRQVDIPDPLAHELDPTRSGGGGGIFPQTWRCCRAGACGSVAGAELSACSVSVLQQRRQRR